MIGVPVYHAGYPLGRIETDRAARVELGDLCNGDCPLVAVGNEDRPLLVSRALLRVVRDGATRRDVGSVHDDGRAALLAANLRDLSANLLVCNRVLRLAGLTR